MHLYQLIRDGKTTKTYHRMLIDTLYDKIKMGQPQRVHSEKHPTRCLWASPGEEGLPACVSDTDEDRDNTVLFCDTLGGEGDEKFVACLDAPVEGTGAEYDKIYRELALGASTVYLCANCVLCSGYIFRVNRNTVKELTRPDEGLINLRRQAKEDLNKRIESYWNLRKELRVGDALLGATADAAASGAAAADETAGGGAAGEGGEPLTAGL
jgi:hypothetical protein